jgi:hypothetical protein
LRTLKAEEASRLPPAATIPCSVCATAAAAFVADDDDDDVDDEGAKTEIARWRRTSASVMKAEIVASLAAADACTCVRVIMSAILALVGDGGVWDWSRR